MAGSVSVTYQEHTSVRVVELDWTSSADTGAADGVTKALNGVLCGVQFVPDGAPTAPSNNYDVTLKDPYGLDVLCALGTNLSDTTAVFYAPMIVNGAAGTIGVPPPVNGLLTLAVTGAGNSKGGKIVLYLR